MRILNGSALNNNGINIIGSIIKFASIVLLSFAIVGCIPSPRPDISNGRNISNSQCIANLQTRNVKFALNEGRVNGSCSTKNTIILQQYGITASNLGPMTCGVATQFINWSNGSVNRAALQIFGSAIARIETFGTYSCRNIAGSARRSEHASANAVDVSGFILKDGRRISVLRDWNGSRDEKRFLRQVRDDACRHFGTILSPDYNAAHKDHFHLDNAQRGFGSFCR